MATVRTFRDVIGHQRVLDLLGREGESPTNAYLFVGAGGVGKATVARRFAEILLCPAAGRHDEPCDTCRRVAAGIHPDLIVVEPEGRRSLGVDQARDMITAASRTPVEAVRKVFVVEEAGAMTLEAANALLKTLEEPSASTVFVLVAEGEDDLPPTVASRCRTIHFGRVDETDLAASLISAGLEPDRAAMLARVAGGRPGLALSLVADERIAEFRRAWLAVPLRVTDRPGEAFDLAREMIATLGPDKPGAGDHRARQALLSRGLEIVASWYVDAAAVQLGGLVRNRDVPVASLTRVSPGVAVRNAELVLDAVSDLRLNLRPQLLLANLFTGLSAE